MFNLETAVGREKDVHAIDVHGEFEKLVVTFGDESFFNIQVQRVCILS